MSEQTQEQKQEHPPQRSNKKCIPHQRVWCLICHPNLACPNHPFNRKNRCRICGVGNDLCKHKRQKNSCAECKKEGVWGSSFCMSSGILKRDCRCVTCNYKRVVRGGIIKSKYNRAPQAQQGAVVLYEEQPQGTAVLYEERVQGVEQEQGEDGGGWYDYDNADVFENERSDDDRWETEGGKRKRKRKQRFTRRLRRRNHNTKKSKIVKRKITKHSRKNKYKLK